MAYPMLKSEKRWCARNDLLCIRVRKRNTVRNPGKKQLGFGTWVYRRRQPGADWIKFSFPCMLVMYPRRHVVWTLRLRLLQSYGILWPAYSRRYHRLDVSSCKVDLNLYLYIRTDTGIGLFANFKMWSTLTCSRIECSMRIAYTNIIDIIYKQNRYIYTKFKKIYDKFNFKTTNLE